MEYTDDLKDRPCILSDDLKDRHSIKFDGYGSEIDIAQNADIVHNHINHNTNNATDTVVSFNNTIGNDVAPISYKVDNIFLSAIDNNDDIDNLIKM